MLSGKRAISITLVLIMLASALIIFSGAEADPTRASDPTLTNHSVSSSTGYNNTLFNFTIWYTDAENDTPVWVKVVIDDVSHNMTGNRGGNGTYAAGIEFYYTTYLTAGWHSYYYITSNVLRETAMDRPNGTQNGTYHVEVHQFWPQLYCPSTSPNRPDNSTGVTFTVRYRHPGGRAPTYVRVNITTNNQTTYLDLSTKGTNYTAGVDYTGHFFLPPGTYHYTYEAATSANESVSRPSPPFPGVYMIYIRPQNLDPILSHPGYHPNYYPAVGTNITFWVHYSDAEGNPPSRIYLYYYPEGERVKSIGVNLTVRSGNFSTGVNCTTTIQIWKNGTYYYLFYARDGAGGRDTTDHYPFHIGDRSIPLRDPVLSNGYHRPISPTVNDTVNFMVTYTDPLGYRTPHSVKVYLTNQDLQVRIPTVYNMTRGSGDLLNGTPYRYMASLLAGNYSYYFHAIIGNYSTSYPNVYSLNLTVTNRSTTPPPPLKNKAPLLSSGNHSPIRPTTDSNITFSVTYADRDGDAPSFIKLHINKKTSGRPKSVYNMTWTERRYVDGVRAQCTLRLTTGNYSYYFNASSNVNNVALMQSWGRFFTLTVAPATPPPSSQQDGAPILSRSSMAPTSPTANRTIYFSILYTDADNDAPSSVRFHLLSGPSTSYANYSVNVPRGTYSNGVTCTYSTSLPAGTYYYYFTASSNNYTVSYPLSGTISFNVTRVPTPTPYYWANTGARTTIIRDDGTVTMDVTEKEEGFTISVVGAGEDFIEIEVSSESGEDRVIEMILDPEMFDIDSPDDIVVKVDGKEISYTYVADPDEWTGDEPAYYIRYKETGAVLYVLLPEADRHTITAEIPDEEPGDSGHFWYYILAILVIVVIASAITISLLTASRKKRIREYYDDFDTDVRDERITSGKLIDEDEIDWNDLRKAE